MSAEFSEKAGRRKAGDAQLEHDHSRSAKRPRFEHDRKRQYKGSHGLPQHQRPPGAKFDALVRRIAVMCFVTPAPLSTSSPLLVTRNPNPNNVGDAEICKLAYNAANKRLSSLVIMNTF